MFVQIPSSTISLFLMAVALLSGSVSCKRPEAIQYPEPGGITQGILTPQEQEEFIRKWTGGSVDGPIHTAISHYQYHHDGEKLIGFRYLVIQMPRDVADALDCQAHLHLQAHHEKVGGVFYEYENYFIEYYNHLSIGLNAPVMFWSDGEAHGLRVYLDYDPNTQVIRISEAIGGAPDPHFQDYLKQHAPETVSVQRTEAR